MKKRRELDALVTGGKAPKNGRHELLRNESDSSEVEEFAMPQKTVVRQRVRSQCCSTCMTMCSIFLLVICMVSIGGLIWMVIELKNEVTDIRNRITSAETGLKETKWKINEMGTSDSEAHNQISSFGDVVQVLQANFSDLSKQLKLTDLRITEISSKASADNSKAASDELQTKMDDLSQTVADLGSTVRSVDLERTKLNERFTALQTNLSSIVTTNQLMVSSKMQNMQLELEQLSSDLSTVNETLSQTCEDLSKQVLTDRGDLNTVMNWTSEIRREISVKERDHNSTKSNFSAGVEREVSNRTIHLPSELEKIREDLTSRIASLEAVVNDQIVTFLNLTFDINQLNSTLWASMTRNLPQIPIQLFNETTQGLIARLELVETDLANFKTLVHELTPRLGISVSPVDAAKNGTSGATRVAEMTTLARKKSS